MNYQYKMTQVPTNFVITNANEANGIASEHFERLANDYARHGWEFYRIDTVNVFVQPGCLGLLLGRRSMNIPYCLVTFRRAI